MSIPLDKQAHFLAGVAISSLTFIVTHSVIAALLVTLAVAIAKEAYDKLSKRGTPELSDVLYTVAGAVATISTVMVAGYAN